ncbi:MAG: hypothetical protein Q9165_000166 [Trypethelium subeluteriae]
MDVNSLLSPPEAKRPEPFLSSSNRQTFTPLNSFNADNQLPPMSKIQQSSTQNRLPLSPPISPYTAAPKHNASYSPPANTERDPELFPIEEDGSVAPGPLFPPDIAATVDSHMMNRKEVDARYQPTREEYMAVASMVSSVVKQMKVNPVAWHRRERAYLDKRAAARRPLGSGKQHNNQQNTREYQKIAPKKPKAGAAKKEKHPELAPKPTRIARPPRQPKHQISESADGENQISPKSPGKPATKEDVDYNSIPDLSPPIETLSDNSKSMKIDWKGQIRDLSQDPDRYLLHEKEVQVAGILRLSCAQYLTAKRRIFIARINCEKDGKEFRKTDSQQACKIDVNKASKLWTAFEKVGWLDRSWISKYL